MRKYKTEIKQRQCIQCESVFQPARLRQTFCSPACRNGFHNDRRARIESGYHKAMELLDVIAKDGLTSAVWDGYTDTKGEYDEIFQTPQGDS